MQPANTATGSQAMFNNTDGYLKQANGYFALYNNYVWYKHTANGSYTLLKNITGGRKYSLGYLAGVATSNLFNATAIGANSSVACSNCLVLGPVNNNSGFSTTTKVDVVIGTQSPQTDLHINPDGAGSILIGTNRISGDIPI